MRKVKSVPLHFKQRDGVTVGVALERCAKRRHLGSLFDVLLVCTEREVNLRWERVERHAVHVVVAEEAVEKGFHQLVICEELHGTHSELLESREDCAEAELQKCCVGFSSTMCMRHVKCAEMVLESDSLWIVLT